MLATEISYLLWIIQPTQLAVARLHLHSLTVSGLYSTFITFIHVIHFTCLLGFWISLRKRKMQYLLVHCAGATICLRYPTSCVASHSIALHMRCYVTLQYIRKYNFIEQCMMYCHVVLLHESGDRALFLVSFQLSQIASTSVLHWIRINHLGLPTIQPEVIQPHMDLNQHFMYESSNERIIQCIYRLRKHYCIQRNGTISMRNRSTISSIHAG